MSGPFTLRVDPDGVEAAAATFARMATALDEQAGRLHDVAPGLAHAFQGKAATTLDAEVGRLATRLAGAGPKVREAIDALRGLAARYRQAVQTEVPRLNREWQDASDTRADRGTTAGAGGALAATRHRLRGEFDRLRDELRTETSRAGNALAAAVQLAVPAGAATPGSTASVPAWAWTGMAGTLPLTALAHALESPPGPTDPAALKQLLDTARAAGLAPTEYAPLLQNYYLALALERAGIDWTKWNPELGAAALTDIIYKGYEYYGKLFEAHTPSMRWAGIANMIGPSFAGGFLDLGMLRSAARHLAMGLPAGSPVEVLANMSDDELRYFETTMLGMQKEIFVDQAPMHEAYLAGGLPAVEEMAAAGIIPTSMVDGWTDIDHGWRDCDPAAIERGTLTLSHREQYDIIGDDYDRMRRYHGPVGEVFTYAITAVGAPSVPGAHAFGEVYPIGGTGFPAGNVSNADQRWALYTTDILPAYEHLVETNAARGIIAAPIEDRVAHQRLQEQWPRILARLVGVK